MSKGKGEVPERWWRGEITFRIKLHARQRPSEGSNKTLCTPGPNGPIETEPEQYLSAPAEVQVSSGLP